MNLIWTRICILIVGVYGLGMSGFDLSYTQLPKSLYAASRVEPAPVPELLVQNPQLAKDLGLDPRWVSSLSAQNLFTGQTQPKTYEPIAMAYAGHQFGHLSPKLGDGRAVLIGEHVSSNGVRYDLHLKGSGQTPYARRGDGKATLRAGLKEVLFSESLAALGVPTTRALAVFKTGETIVRDGPNPGAILVRTARSHIRVGTFVYAARLPDDNTLKALADFTIAREYPDLFGDEIYQQFLIAVIQRQAQLIALWMSHGFVHGVMNTDNMAISGESIDFGPCAFMDGFHASSVYSAIDHHGRYAWNRQPEIAVWNLTQFAQSLLPLLSADEAEALRIAEDALGQFNSVFSEAFNTQFLHKLGLSESSNTPDGILKDMFTVLQATNVDFTLFFRHLPGVLTGDGDVFFNLFNDMDGLEAWLTQWQAAIKNTGKAQADIIAIMNGVNPLYIPRTYQVEAALKDANLGEMDAFTSLLLAVQSPYRPDIQFEGLDSPPKDKTYIQTHCET